MADLSPVQRNVFLLNSGEDADQNIIYVHLLFLCLISGRT